jgi:hypothetical protein
MSGQKYSIEIIGFFPDFRPDRSVQSVKSVIEHLNLHPKFSLYSPEFSQSVRVREG